MYIKDFDGWNETKKRVDAEDKPVYVNPGDVRWIIFGVNVGSEVDGKAPEFTRPGLVLHVIGSYLALVIPMSTSSKPIIGYLPFEFQGEKTSLCINQMRIVSLKRILSRKGNISGSRLSDIKQKVAQFFSLNN